DIAVSYLEENLTSLKNEKQNIINKINNQDNYQIKDNKHIDDKPRIIHKVTLIPVFIVLIPIF
ncbi:hypothetical protein ACTPEF_26350, partial [Clostridioides difficile]